MGNVDYRPDPKFDAAFTKRWNALVAEVHRKHSGDPVPEVEAALAQEFRRAGVPVDRQAITTLAEWISDGRLPTR